MAENEPQRNVPNTMAFEMGALPLGLLQSYRCIPDVHDEIFRQDGSTRPGLAALVRLFDGMSEAEFRVRQRLADGAFLKGGVTFSVYSDSRGVEKIFPFDLIPRAVSAAEWERLQRGLVQRILALDRFLDDVYGEQRILKEDRVPRDAVEGSTGYLPAVHGLKPPGGVRIHVAGIDIVRGSDGEYVVLEDNLRTPSGVSYVLENRSVMKRILPRIFAKAQVRQVDEYPTRLRSALAAVAPPRPGGPRVVVLTPGPFNSAYFEHAFLARRMGCDLVQGSDLFVSDRRVYVKTTAGPEPVDVIYRRIDDEYLDPTVFRKDSVLGVPGLFGAYAAGHVALANAPGNGVADDKGIYPFVPEMIRFYLSEEPVLGQVETFHCSRDEDRKHVLGRLESMVVKTVDGSGGYGMLVGPKSTRAERDAFAKRIEATPRKYIAQPVVELSTCPTWCGDRVAPRRVDLRPYIVTGTSPWVLPGGLTRVALVEGSYVVNSSQGGGSKDTWVLAS